LIESRQLAARWAGERVDLFYPVGLATGILIAQTMTAGALVSLYVWLRGLQHPWWIAAGRAGAAVTVYTGFAVFLLSPRTRRGDVAEVLPLGGFDEGLRLPPLVVLVVGGGVRPRDGFPAWSMAMVADPGATGRRPSDHRYDLRRA